MKKTSDMLEADRVLKMYVKNDTLTTRIGLHEKYSVNRYGWANWVFDQYTFSEEIRVLELACGTAVIWQNRQNRLPNDFQIILSDFSPIMVEKAKDLMSGQKGFSIGKIDIQNIPYEDSSFDMIIANHMLYHVPDLDKALSEVSRVLKNGGRFYCTTIGENSLRELQDIYRMLEGKAVFSYTKGKSFTLENGLNSLCKHFAEIERREYIDSLEVTDIDDLIAYIKSYNDVPESVDSELYSLVKNGFSNDGVFRVSKEQGMFVCIK